MASRLRRSISCRRLMETSETFSTKCTDTSCWKYASLLQAITLCLTFSGIGWIAGRKFSPSKQIFESIALSSANFFTVVGSWAGPEGVCLTRVKDFLWGSWVCLVFEELECWSWGTSDWEPFWADLSPLRAGRLGGSFRYEEWPWDLLQEEEDDSLEW